jgi:hypothetical protein
MIVLRRVPFGNEAQTGHTSTSVTRLNSAVRLEPQRGSSRHLCDGAKWADVWGVPPGNDQTRVFQFPWSSTLLANPRCLCIARENSRLTMPPLLSSGTRGCWRDDVAISRAWHFREEKSEGTNANARVPKGRNSLAQHAAEGGVLGRVRNEPEPRRGGTASSCVAG